MSSQQSEILAEKNTYTNANTSPNIPPNMSDEKQALGEEMFTESDFGAFLSRYEGFGSFFSADVEELIRQKDSESTVPPFPIFTRLDCCIAATTNNFITPTEHSPSSHSQEERSSSGNALRLDYDIGATKEIGTLINPTSDAVIASLPPPPPFGRPFRDMFFGISNDFTFINHGAFGGALKLGVYLKQRFEGLMETQLLTYMDRLVLPWITHCAREIANTVLHCSPTDVVLIPNATYGLNAAIAGLITHGDVVVFLETEYLAVFKMLQERCETLLGASVRSGGVLPPAALIELPLDGLLLSEIMGDDDALTSHIVKYLPPETTVIVLDLITSTAALHLPVFTHLIPALKKALPKLRHIIVDGAHGPLQCEVNIGALRPDQMPSVYVGNLHKWFSAPKSVGLMWVREDVQEELRPIIVSHGAKNGFLSDFVWDGTRDHGAVLTLPTIIAFWYKYIGIDRVRLYCSELKKKAISMLSSAWESEKAELPRSAPFMSLVMLPPFFQHHSRFITAKYLQDTLHRTHKIEVPVKIIRGQLFFRVSFFVNNEMNDYEVLRDAVLSIQGSVIANLMIAREGRLARVPEKKEDQKGELVGSKRDRSEDGNAAINSSRDILYDSELQKRLQQQHHDKSQILKVSSAKVEDVDQPVRNSFQSPSTSTSHFAFSGHLSKMSAAYALAPFKPDALGVPLNIGGLSPIVVKLPIVAAGSGESGAAMGNGASPIRDLDSSAALPILTDATKHEHLHDASNGPALTVAMTSAHSPSSNAQAHSTVDPNCNGCGIGGLGAVPKKTRKF